MEYGYDREADNYDSTGDVCFLADDLAWLMCDGLETLGQFMILGRLQYWSLIDLIFFELYLFLTELVLRSIWSELNI